MPTDPILYSFEAEWGNLLRAVDRVAEEISRAIPGLASFARALQTGSDSASTVRTYADVVEGARTAREIMAVSPALDPSTLSEEGRDLLRLTPGARTISTIYVGYPAAGIGERIRFSPPVEVDSEGRLQLDDDQRLQFESVVADVIEEVREFVGDSGLVSVNGPTPVETDEAPRETPSWDDWLARANEAIEAKKGDRR